MPVKKKTRRGSRGGRNRKKKPAGAVTAEGPDAEGPGAEDAVGVTTDGVVTDETEAETETPLPSSPRIHVPDFELGGEEKPSRRRAAPKPKPQPAADSEEGEDEAPEQIGEAVAAESTDDGDAPPVKKKTRRGSRGGRNRKKPAAAAGAATVGAAVVLSENGAEAPSEPVPDEREASGNGAEPAADEYVPMSEWLDDLDA